MSGSNLTAKQALFAKEYIVDLVATQAAIRAGYSQKTAGQIGFELLQKPEIQAAIAEEMRARSKRTEITADRVLEEFAKIGFADIRNAVQWGVDPVDTESENSDPNGLGIYPVKLVASDKIDGDTAAAVSEVSLTQTGVKIKMHDKKAALDSIARHLGMFPSKVELTGKDGGPIQSQVTIDPSQLSTAAQEEILNAAIDEGGSDSD